MPGLGTLSWSCSGTGANPSYATTYRVDPKRGATEEVTFWSDARPPRTKTVQPGEQISTGFHRVGSYTWEVEKRTAARTYEAILHIGLGRGSSVGCFVPAAQVSIVSMPT